MTPIEALIRDARAQRAARLQYEEAARLHFEVEDVLRMDPVDVEKARRRHRAGIIAGHAAWAELANPEPR